MAIKIVARLAKVKQCYGCGAHTNNENYYEGDTTMLWCDDCFVTDDKLKELHSQMPFCQPSKPKIRIVAALKPKPKKIKCTVVARLSVPFD